MGPEKVTPCIPLIYRMLRAGTRRDSGVCLKLGFSGFRAVRDF